MDPTVPPASVVDGQLAAEPSPPGMCRWRSVDGLLLPRPHPICMCRQPPVSALSSPLPGTGGDLGEANRIGVLAEKILLLAYNNNNKPESYPDLVQVLMPQASGSQNLVISLAYSDLLHLLGLGARQPRLVIYKYEHNLVCPLCALPKLLFCKYFSRSSPSSNRDCTPTAAPSIAMVMNFGALPVLSKLLGLSPPSLLKKKTLLIDTAVGTLPELPEDILMHVFATLEIPDLVRAGSVCTLWHSAYTTLCNLGKYKQTQTPCLLYTSESAGENVACLYSLVEKRVYRLTLPEPPLSSRFLIGSSLGFLATVDDRSEMHLVNPITGQQIALPSVTTMEYVKPIFDDLGVVHKYEYPSHSARRAFFTPSILAGCELRECLQIKAFVFHDTSTGRYIVVLIHEPYNHLSFARVGDDKWTLLPPHHHYQDCTYKDGLLYAVDIKGEIHAFDLSGPAVTMKIIRGVDEDFYPDAIYIVEAPWGGLLLVSRFKEFEDPDEDGDPEIYVPHTTEIKLHRIDDGTERLVEIDCLPDHVLFLGHNDPLCLSAKDYPALKGNHAYFTDDDEYNKNRKSSPRDIGVVGLGNNSEVDLVSPLLWSNWPSPVWLTPSLTVMKLPSNDRWLSEWDHVLSRPSPTEATVGTTLLELPEDIMMRVFATLEIPDLVRAGAVCTFWRSAYTALRKLGTHKQPQMPCLLYCSESSSENVACLYSLVEKRVYRLTLPEPPLHSRFLIGSSLGLLVTVDERSEMHLVNPITGQQIALPSVTTMQHVKPMCDDSGAVHKY
ncbi:hypothetical protein CFC21_075668 [Triticum aestivum]|uniref:F-box domain-containing protein n=2 Tax=Triticum aestivum TaxID=4565 RepID=A0A9R1KXL9_WHEAT|nr:uncharacterized protein LOC123119201 [Triticum aestivum]KAF7070115.1 hypothetical protein CFC21_075668 [Triticum aestivum]